MGDEYGASERQALRGLFDIYDKDGSGFVNEEELAVIMEKVGRDPSQAKQLLHEVDPDHNGKVTFEEFLKILSLGREQPEDADDAAADKKVVEFLRILNEYRMKCEEEGKYLEAERASQQLATLQAQEKKRQKRQFRAKQIAERQDVQIAHNMQFAEFNQSWDKYMQEYDQMAQLYIQQMTEKHAKQLKEHQEMIIQKVMSQPPKFTRELLDWRRRQHLLAKRKNYAEAQKIKRLTDKLEEKEMRKIAEKRKKTIKKLEAQFRQEQQKELTALLKRIDGRRKEHIKQRNEDSKRLLQRNKNVQNVLESKQTVQMQKQQEAIKGALRIKKKSRHRSESGIPPRRGGGGSKTFVTES
eukprot:INCI9378.2.p2 GENE.INCI9378.2~~INCI9378.2.p2  ORF type:complete len:355 (-),score=92.88 INCI9378.2:1934-2998(-)